MRHAISAIAAVVLLCGCASQAILTAKPPDSEEVVEKRALLVGFWFSDEPTKEGGRRYALSQKNADGTFKIHFRVIEGGRITMDETEVGLWGLSGPVYFTITKGWLHGYRLEPADPTNPYFYDAYEVLSLKEGEFKYRSYVIGDTYTSKKVQPDFELPTGEDTQRKQ